MPGEWDGEIMEKGIEYILVCRMTIVIIYRKILAGQIKNSQKDAMDGNLVVSMD